MRYRLIDPTVDAEQFTGTKEQMERFKITADNRLRFYGGTYRHFLLPTPLGHCDLNIGDFLVSHDKKNYYPTRCDIFLETYRPDSERDVLTEHMDGGRLG